MTSTAGRGRCAKSVLAAKPPPHSLQDVVNQGRIGKHDVGFFGMACLYTLTFQKVLPHMTFYKLLASHIDLSLNDGSRGCKKCSSKIEISAKDRERLRSG